MPSLADRKEHHSKSAAKKREMYHPPGSIASQNQEMAKKSNIIASFDDIKGRRETNKQQVFQEQLEIEGRKEKDLLIRQEFYRLRGEHGIQKTNVELLMDRQMQDLELKIRNKKHQRIADKAHDTHSFFISKENADAALRARRLKKRQLQQIIEKNSKAVGKPLLKKGQKEEDT